MTTSQANRIRALNDDLRQHLIGGGAVMTGLLRRQKRGHFRGLVQAGRIVMVCALGRSA